MSSPRRQLEDGASIVRPRVAPRLADAEVEVPDRFLGAHLDGVDGGEVRSVATPSDHPFDGCLVALERGLDPSVGQVPHPAADAEPPGFRGTGPSEEDSLNPAGHEHAHAGGHSFDTRSSWNATDPVPRCSSSTFRTTSPT